MARLAMARGRGQTSPRASTVVTIAIVTEAPPLELAVIFATGEVERLYSGLSVLASTAADGAGCVALASFRALTLLMDPDLGRRAQEPDSTPDLSWAGRETFGRSLG